MKSVTSKMGLIQAAWELFTQKGYDNTTIKDILEKVRLAKGTFYHYFTSKEGILDAVINYIIAQQTSKWQEQLQDEDIGAVGKLYLYFEHFKNWKVQNKVLIRQLVRTVYSDKNIKFRHAFFAKTTDQIAPILAEILTEGVSEGVFRVEYPQETARLLLKFGYAMGDELARTLMALLDNPDDPSLLEQAERNFKIYFSAFERIIGAEDGTLDMVNSADLRSMFNAD